MTNSWGDTDEKTYGFVGRQFAKSDINGVFGIGIDVFHVVWA